MATYKSKCIRCIWGAKMPVKIIVDQWEPSKVKHRFETFHHKVLPCDPCIMNDQANKSRTGIINCQRGNFFYMGLHFRRIIHYSSFYLGKADKRVLRRKKQQ
jgi:hypothetical protein